MKHKIVNIFLFLAIGVCAMACGNDDEQSSDGDEQASQVSLTVILPKTIATSKPVGVSNQLRCILEIWSKETAPQLIYRTEVIKPGDQTDEFPLNFKLQSGTYNCLIWADYINKDAEAEQKTASEGIVFTHYTDKYYNTLNLKQVTAINAKHFIDNDACDAFFYNGEFQKKDNEVCLLKADLIRPFTKVSIRENDKEALKRIKSLSFSYNFSTTFDVGSGQVLEDKSLVNYSNNNYDPETVIEGTFFMMYVLTSSDGRKMDAVSLHLEAVDGAIQDVIIPKTIVTLERGKHIKVNGDIVRKLPDPDVEFEIIYDVNVDDWNFEDVNV